MFLLIQKLAKQHTEGTLSMLFLVALLELGTVGREVSTRLASCCDSLH